MNLKIEKITFKNLIEKAELAYKNKICNLYQVAYNLYESAKTERFKILYKNLCWKILSAEWEGA